MRSILLALLLAPLAASAQAPEALFNLVTLNAQAEREVPNDLLSAVLVAEAQGTDAARLSSEMTRAMQRAQPAIEPGTTRILITVSGTVQLQ